MAIMCLCFLLSELEPEISSFATHNFCFIFFYLFIFPKGIKWLPHITVKSSKILSRKEVTAKIISLR